MNKTDSERVQRLLGAINEIPGAIKSGTQTATAKSYVAYAVDIAEFQAWLKQYLTDYLIDYHWRGKEKEMGFVFEDEFPGWIDPDIQLDNLEAWIQRRKEDNWEMQSSTLLVEKINK